MPTEKNILQKLKRTKINLPEKKKKRKLDSEKMDKILLNDKTEGHDEKNILELTARDKEQMSTTMSVTWLEQS